MLGWVLTAISQISESAMPMITPASTPTSRVAASAARAIQKSKRWTRASRRISGTFIMPMTTASMIRAPMTAFGKLENSGARNNNVSSTVAPETMEDSCVFAPE